MNIKYKENFQNSWYQLTRVKRVWEERESYFQTCEMAQHNCSYHKTRVLKLDSWYPQGKESIPKLSSDLHRKEIPSPPHHMYAHKIKINKVNWVLEVHVKIIFQRAIFNFKKSDITSRENNS